VNAEPYEMRFQAAARRAIAERLPESVAAAVLEFCEAALALSPRRVGKPLFGPLSGCHGARRGTYRVVYRIDEQAHVVNVLDIDHRADIYRRPLVVESVRWPERRAPGLFRRVADQPQHLKLRPGQVDLR
jgi:mRNA interferase RelE/StbE